MFTENREEIKIQNEKLKSVIEKLSRFVDTKVDGMEMHAIKE